MRYRIFIALLLYSGLCIAQADTVFVLGAAFGAYTAPTDSTFQIASIHPTDQLGQAFTAAKIQVGYRLIDAYGRLYRVKTVDNTGIGSSTLTVVELQNSDAPSGSGIVYRSPTNSDCIPEIQAGNVGISPIVVAKIANHNAVNGCTLDTDDQTAVEVLIIDAGAHYTGAEVETALQEVGDSLVAIRADVGTGGGGSTEVADLSTILGVGSVGDPFTVDTTLIATQDDLTTFPSGTLTEDYIPVADATGNLEDSQLYQDTDTTKLTSGNYLSILDGQINIARSVSSVSFLNMYNSTGTLIFEAKASGTPSSGLFKYYNKNGIEQLRTGATVGVAMYLSSGSFDRKTYLPSNFATAGSITASNFAINQNNDTNESFAPSYTLEINGDDAMLIPRGTTGERPAGEEALLRYNETLDRFEGHDNVGYNSLAYLTDLTTSYGEMYIPTGTPDTLTFSSGSVTPQKAGEMAGTTQDFTFTSGRLTYDGTDTKNFEFLTSISFSFSENTTSIYGYLTINGVEQLNCGFHRTISTNGRLGSASMSGIISLDTNDYVEVFFYPSAHNGDDELIIENMNVSVIQL